jgi:hypothetical protein
MPRARQSPSTTSVRPASRGAPSAATMQRAGHADFATARIYMREAENLATGFGEVFPPLPAELLLRPTSGARRVLASVSAFGVAKVSATLETKALQARHRGFEPDPSVGVRRRRSWRNNADRATQDDAKRREVSASEDVVEAALARAIEAEVSTRGADGRRAWRSWPVNCKRGGSHAAAWCSSTEGAAEACRARRRHQPRSPVPCLKRPLQVY